MKNKLVGPSFLVVCIVYSHSFAASSSTWAVDFSDAIMQRHPGSINDMTGKGWEYSNGIVLQGIERTYAYTKTAAYIEYIKKYVDQYVDANGKVSFDTSVHSLDKMHPAILCLFLYKETNQQKYKLAADYVLSVLKRQPTNPSGGFSHKDNNLKQMLLDGIYMAEPFLAKYGYQIGEQSYCDSMAAFQILLLSSHAYVASKKLLLHGWDETKQASWADKTTGLSSEIWSRAMGWFSMALVEVLKYFPKDHPKYDSLLALLNNIAEGIKNTQDDVTGLWHQVVDKGNLSDNWLESSGSGMMVYALKTAVDCGFIDKSYLAVAQKGWTGMKTKITLDDKNLPVINGFVGSMNVLNDYAAYVGQEVVSCPPSSGSKQHPHGYCAVLMAASAMELAKTRYRLSIATSGQGSVTNPTGEMFHDSGTTVTLTAVPGSGQRLIEWSGDGSGSDTTIAVLMNKEKTVTATFLPTSSVIPSFSQSFGRGIGLRFEGNRACITLPLEKSMQITITLFNGHGRTVRSIAQGFFSAGSHAFYLTTRRLAPGAYVVRIQSSGIVLHDLPLVIVEGN
ncbi:MAG: glycoside hydrolase family 88 protein [Chitinispirillaceae bacterium]|nr:glycoside hydrolase family 88 protein [Chitinispirillaceae bacterium]